MTDEPPPELPPKAAVSERPLDVKLADLLLGHASSRASGSLPSAVERSCKALLRQGARVDVIVRLAVMEVTVGSRTTTRKCVADASALTVLCRRDELLPLLRFALEQQPVGNWDILLPETDTLQSNEDQQGMTTPLAAALRGSNAAAVKLLLEKGASAAIPCWCEAVDDASQPAYCATYGQPIVRWPLHVAMYPYLSSRDAVKRGQDPGGRVSEIVRLLLGAGADVNARTYPHKITPLHLVLNATNPPGAPKWDCAAIPLQLMEAGADIHAIRSDTQSRPLDTACG